MKYFHFKIFEIFLGLTSWLPQLLATFVASLTVNAGRIALDNLGSNPWFSGCCDECICSPNFPDPYPEELDITYTLTAPAGEKVKMQVLNFQVGPNNETAEIDTACDNQDYVEITGIDFGCGCGIEKVFGLDQLGYTTEQIAQVLSQIAGKPLKICGKIDMTPVVSLTNELTIKFHTTKGTKGKTETGFIVLLSDEISQSYVVG